MLYRQNEMVCRLNECDILNMQEKHIVGEG